MKILLLGNGGREHALVWKLRQSARVSKVYCAPGNGGIAGEAECLPVDLKSLESIVALGQKILPDLTVVGPELPLTMGVVDEFTRWGWPVFGPTKAAAELEGSKSFAKEFMQRHRIPTAAYAICDSVEEVREALTHFHVPVFLDDLGGAFGTTRFALEAALKMHKEKPLSGQLEIETYTWDVLPEHLKTGDIVDYVCREIEWVRGQLA